MDGAKAFSPRSTRDAAVSWFHGKLTRDAAEHVLKIHGGDQGIYLVRESNTSPGDYVLSVVHEDKCIHYQIRRHGEDAFFSIDDGPILHGLETLIEYYQQGERGLLSQLGPMCPGQPPPPDTLCHGRSNLLHRATIEGESLVVGELLKSGYHSLDAKNHEGQTAVHLAISHGHTHILRMLLESGANANIKESRGLSPLHYACSENSAESCRILLHLGKANSQLRATTTGWVPMHEAASRGHLEVIKVLLEFGAPCHPRSFENLTPLDMAKLGNHKECEEVLESFEPIIVAKMERSCWFHDAMERQRSTLLLQQHGTTDGLFLIRKSIRNPASHVLSMVNGTHIYQFEIRKKDHFYFIDDGPLLVSLEHIVDHYSRFSDGLPTRLVKPVVPIRSDQQHTLQSQIDNNANHLPKIVPELFLGPNLIRRESLTLGEIIGEGEYGSVLRGTFIGPGKINTDVAIKMLHEDHVQQSRDEFVREVEVMSTLRHPCIVHLVGVCLGPPLMMVTELVSMGSLLDFLLDAYAVSSSAAWDGDLRLWAGQIASGMAYLEGKRFVHRDLAARNILLSSREQIKISDFGLSRVLGAGSEYYKATGGGRWPVKWYAPESINFGTFSHASDVWSYGVTLWEMFTFGAQPYGDLNGQEVMELIEDSQRLPRPADCSDDVYNIMKRCWSYNPDKRPTFSGLHQHFLGLRNDLILKHTEVNKVVNEETEVLPNQPNSL